MKTTKSKEVSLNKSPSEYLLRPELFKNIERNERPD
jgi:hypothetical protein